MLYVCRMQLHECMKDYVEAHFGRQNQVCVCVCVCVHACVRACACTVESLNKGHFGTVILSFVSRLSFIGKSKIYWNYREKILWDLKLCPL